MQATGSESRKIAGDMSDRLSERPYTNQKKHWARWDVLGGSTSRRYLPSDRREPCHLVFNDLDIRKISDPYADPPGVLTTFLDPGHAFIRFEDYRTGHDEFIGFYPLGRSKIPLYKMGVLGNESCHYNKKSDDFYSLYPHHKTNLTHIQLQTLREFLSKTIDACERDEFDCAFMLLGFNCVDFAQKAHKNALLPGHFADKVKGGSIDKWGKARIYGTVKSYLPSFVMGALLVNALYPVVTYTWANLKAAWRGEKASDTRLSEFITRYQEIDKKQLQLEKFMDDLLMTNPDRDASNTLIELQKMLVDIQSELLSIEKDLSDDKKQFKAKPLPGHLKLNEDKLNEANVRLKDLTKKINELRINVI